MLPKSTKICRLCLVSIFFLFILLFGYRFKGLAEEDLYPIVEWDVFEDPVILTEDEVTFSAVCDFGPEDSTLYARFWWWKESEGQELKVDSISDNGDDDAYENNQSFLIRSRDVDDPDWDGVSFEHILDFTDLENKSTTYEWVGDWKVRVACKSVEGVYKHSEQQLIINEADVDSGDTESPIGSSEDTNEDDLNSSDLTGESGDEEVVDEGSEDNNEDNNEDNSAIIEDVNPESEDSLDKEGKDEMPLHPISNSTESISSTTDSVVVVTDSAIDLTEPITDSTIENDSKNPSTSAEANLNTESSLATKEIYEPQYVEVLAQEDIPEVVAMGENSNSGGFVVEPKGELDSLSNSDSNILGEQNKKQERDELKDSLGEGVKVLISLVGSSILIGMVVLLLKKS